MYDVGDIYFKGLWRMDWGFGNPNKTGAFIAMLMIAIWSLAYIRRWGYWVALLVFTALGVCLVHTISRGAAVAAIAGIIPVILYSRSQWRRNQIVGAAVSLSIIAGFAIHSSAIERFGQGLAIEDRSISNRLLIWQKTPQMMRDAPNGWGLGNASRAFTEWYQPLDRTERYINLVNGHLTWLVEFSWPLRFAYIAGMGIALLACLPRKSLPILSIPFGIWVAFLIASMFSMVGDTVWMWILPGASLLLALLYRSLRQEWLALRWWWVPVAGAFVAISTFYLLGKSILQIQGSAPTVAIGRSPTRHWILYEASVLGSFPGRQLRSAMDILPYSEGVGLTKVPSAIPPECDILVIAGSPETNSALKASVQKAGTLVFLNPAFSPQEIDLAPHSLKQVRVVFGDFANSPSKAEWSVFGKSDVIPGCGDFLPNWPEIVFQNHPSRQ